MSPQKINKFKLNAKRNSHKYTKLKHYKILSAYMN